MAKRTTVNYVAAFKKDYKREKKGRHQATFEAEFEALLTMLMNDLPLAPSFNDHPLGGEWKGCRDCHIKSDLVLIYRKTGADTLDLLRVGSHAELFG